MKKKLSSNYSEGAAPHLYITKTKFCFCRLRVYRSMPTKTHTQKCLSHCLCKYISYFKDNNFNLL